MSSFLGRTGLNIRHVLDFAKGAPCVLLLDEIDAVAKRRDDTSEVGELKRLVTVLLQQLDDWPASALLIAATNHPDLLDPAVWRRFESVIDFGKPTSDDVHQFVTRQLADMDVGEALERALALTLTDRSFSEIEHVMLNLKRQVIVQGRSAADLALETARQNATHLSKSARTGLGHALIDAGISQRQVSDITGVARDTLRKLTRTETGYE